MVMAVPGAVLVVVMMRVLLAATMGQVVGTMARMAAVGMVRMVVVMMGHSGIWRSAFSMETAGGTGQEEFNGLIQRHMKCSSNV